jgi:hypothetical protein
MSLAEKPRARHKGMLNGKRYVWRSLVSLAASIGADHETTKELLIEIDARVSQQWQILGAGVPRTVARRLASG